MSNGALTLLFSTFLQQWNKIFRCTEDGRPGRDGLSARRHVGSPSKHVTGRVVTPRPVMAVAFVWARTEARYTARRTPPALKIHCLPGTEAGQTGAPGLSVLHPAVAVSISFFELSSSV